MNAERLYPGDWVKDESGRTGHIQFTDLAACCVTVTWAGEHSGWIRPDTLTRIGQSPRLLEASEVVDVRTRLAAAEERVRSLEKTLGDAMRRLTDGGWCVDHAFVASDDHPADWSCQFVYDDFDGTECTSLEEDHFLGADISSLVEEST